MPFPKCSFQSSLPRKAYSEINTQHPFSACTSDKRKLLWRKSSSCWVNLTKLGGEDGRVCNSLVSLYLESKVCISMVRGKQVAPSSEQRAKVQIVVARGLPYDRVFSSCWSLIGTSTVSSVGRAGLTEEVVSPVLSHSSVYHYLPVARLEQARRQKAQFLRRSPTSAPLC